MNRNKQQWEEFKPPSSGMVNEIDAIREAKEDILELHEQLETIRATWQQNCGRASK